MPAIYMSFNFETDDTVEQRMSKLYLGIISVGEQLYTYNAAISELRKGIEKFDVDLNRMKKQYDELKERLHNKCPCCSCRMVDGICQNYGCESGL